MNPPKQFMQNAYQKKIYILFLNLSLKKTPKKPRKLRTPMCQQPNFIKYLFPSPATIFSFPFLKFPILRPLEYFLSKPKTPYYLTPKYFSYPLLGLRSDLSKQVNDLPWECLHNRTVKEFYVPEIPNVVWILGL